jgi:hypothetical protein
MGGLREKFVVSKDHRKYELYECKNTKRNSGAVDGPSRPGTTVVDNTSPTQICAEWSKYETDSRPHEAKWPNS